ncbi:MAG: hypothetical protein AAGL29_07175 [Bacteroidota bacterium]
MMKKLFLFVVFASIGVLTLSAQTDRTNFRAGFHAGLPVGDAADFSSFSIGVDLNYHWGVSKTLDFGFATGFINAFGKTETVSGDFIEIELDFEDVQFLPIAGSTRIFITPDFKFGGDIGYAIGINEGNDGGFYYAPMVGVQISGTTEIALSYRAVDNEGTFGIVTAGVLFLF